MREKKDDKFVIFLRGGTGVGKTTIARELAKRIHPSVHIEQDVIRYMIVNGLVASRTGLPPGNYQQEYRRQCRLGDKNTIDLTRNFLQAGFNVIIDGFNGGESGDTFYYLENPDKIEWYPKKQYLESKFPKIKIFQIILDTNKTALAERLKIIKKWDEEVISFIMKQRLIFLKSLEQTKYDLFLDTSKYSVDETASKIISIVGRSSS